MLTEQELQQQIRFIVHEIRNQLSVSDVYCEIIRKHLDKLNIESESIERALSCIQKSTKLIANSLIDLRAINNFNPNYHNINELITESIDLSKVYVYDKNITFSAELCENLRIYIDEKKVLACLINIIKNAIEAIETDGFVNIKTEVTENNLKILISNNGKPISKSDEKEIFQDGFTTKKTGSGIGLYLCKKAFEEHGGTLLLAKSDKKKTVFEITIPLKD